MPQSLHKGWRINLNRVIPQFQLGSSCIFYVALWIIFADIENMGDESAKVFELFLDKSNLHLFTIVRFQISKNIHSIDLYHNSTTVHFITCLLYALFSIIYNAVKRCVKFRRKTIPVFEFSEHQHLTCYLSTKLWKASALCALSCVMEKFGWQINLSFELSSGGP